MSDDIPKKVSQYNRRRYTVEGDALEKAKRITLIVEVDGKRYVHVEAREPGMVSFISRPDAPGFDIELIEATGRRYTDRAVPAGENDALAQWQIDALGLE